MKKRVIWISLTLVCMMMLTSCGTLLQIAPAAATANQVVRRMNARLESLDSYRIDVEAAYTAFVGTTRITGSLEGFTIEDQGKNNKDYYIYTEITNRTKTGGSNGKNVTVRNTEAYCDGYAYSYYSESSGGRKLCSPMTKREYLAYIADDNVTRVNLDGCEKRELEKNDDGYTVKYSSYSQASLNDFLDTLGFEAGIFGRDPLDLHVTIKTDKEYYPQTLTMELVFEEVKNTTIKPAFSMTMTYSQFNQVERKTKGLSTDNYKEIESLALLKEIDTMIDDRIQAKKGSFTVKAEASASFTSQSNKQSETYTVSFSRQKGALTFEADVENGRNTQHITYANGEKTTEVNGKSNTDAMSADEAEQFIAELINDLLMGYNPNYVSDIQKTDDGYEITLFTSASGALGQIITSSGAQYSSGSHTVHIKISGGKITAIEHDYRASGTVQTGFNQTSTLKYTGSTTVTFDK